MKLVPLKLPQVRSSFAAAAQSGGTSNKAIAFYASITHDIASFPIQVVLKYDKVWLNEGNAYNSADGKFRVPVDGLYHFYIKTQVRPDSELNLDIARDGKRIVSAFSYGDATFYGSGAASVVLHATKGQVIYVRTRLNNSAHLYGNNWNIFTGYLIQEM